jgi:hypothetical protein
VPVLLGLGPAERYRSRSLLSTSFSANWGNSIVFFRAMGISDS